MYVAVVTPFDVAFLNLDVDSLFVLNRFVDLMFTIVRTLQCHGYCMLLGDTFAGSGS